MEETRRVLGWYSANRNLAFATEEDLVGGIAYETHGTPATDAMIAKAQSADAVLFGAVGGPKWDKLPFHRSRNRACCGCAKDLGLFANLRPALCFDALKEASTLKPEIVSGLDILIVRELTGGVYFGLPKETTTLPDGQKRAVDTQVYTTSEIERIARVAFELARLRGKRVASAEKSNVMVTGVLWREVVHARARRGISRRRALATSWPTIAPCSWCAIPSSSTSSSPTICSATCLSDEAAQLTGSIGMLPSASLGAKGADGRQSALYEPIHGARPTSPARAWPIRSPRSCRSPCACAIRSGAARTRRCWKRRWSACWRKATAPATSCSRA